MDNRDKCNDVVMLSLYGRFRYRLDPEHTHHQTAITEHLSPMDKKEIITQLRAAKSAHIKWRSYAQAMVAGIPVSQEQVPVIHTDCAFGKWYYGAGQSLSMLPSFSAVDVPHEALHAIYIEIYKHINHLEDAGYLRKLKGDKHKKANSRAEVEILLKDLIEMSKTLLTAIELLEREVMMMEDEQIAELI